MKKKNLSLSRLSFNKLTIVEFNSMKSIIGGVGPDDPGTGTGTDGTIKPSKPPQLPTPTGDDDDDDKNPI